MHVCFSEERANGGKASIDAVQRKDGGIAGSERADFVSVLYYRANLTDDSRHAIFIRQLVDLNKEYEAARSVRRALAKGKHEALRRFAARSKMTQK